MTVLSVDRPEERRIAPVISWMIPVPNETAEEFAAFTAWIMAGDEALPLPFVEAAGLDADIVDRNGWIERRNHRFAHERLLKQRLIEREQMEQVLVLAKMREFYDNEMRRLVDQLEDQVTGKAESTAKSVRLLREDIAQATKALSAAVAALARIHSSLEPRAGLTISTKVTAAAQANPPELGAIAQVYEQMRLHQPQHRRIAGQGGQPEADEVIDSEGENTPDR